MLLKEMVLRHGTLLAQGSAWKNLGNRFSGDHLEFQFSDVVGAIGFILLLIGGFWLLGQLSAWQRTAVSKPCPRRLFAELGERHRLSRKERQLCRQVAKELSLDRPAEVFVCDEARKALAQRDAALADRLFR